MNCSHAPWLDGGAVSHGSTSGDWNSRCSCCSFPALSLATYTLSQCFRAQLPASLGGREGAEGRGLPATLRGFGTVQASDVEASSSVGRSVASVGRGKRLSQGPGHYSWTMAACARSSGSSTVGLLLVAEQMDVAFLRCPGLAIPGDSPRLRARQENRLSTRGAPRVRRLVMLMRGHVSGHLQVFHRWRFHCNSANGC